MVFEVSQYPKNVTSDVLEFLAIKIFYPPAFNQLQLNIPVFLRRSSFNGE